MNDKTILGCFAVIGAVILALFFWPVIAFILGAFTGWLFSSVFPGVGNTLIDGLHMFHLEPTLNQLPLFTATLGFIGGFFKSYNTSSK